MAVFNINELPILAQYQFAENDKEKFQGVNKFNKAFWVEDDRVDDFTKYLNEYKYVNNIRNPQLEIQYFNTLKIIICNLIVAYKSNKSYISISLGSGKFVCDITKYEPIHITRTVFKNLIYWLVKDDYLNIYKSPNNPTIGISSLVQILEPIKELVDSYELKFKDIFFHSDYKFVQQKNEAKELIDYTQTEETAYRENILQRYNKLLSNSNITIDEKPISSPVSLNSTYIGKVGSYGRINGAEWINCKSELRKTIKIENKETLEVDISNCSIRLAADLNGKSIPQEINVYDIADIEKELVKKISVIMQNISSSSTVDGLNKVTGAVFNSYIKEVSSRAAIKDIQSGGNGRAAASEKKRYLTTNQSNKEIMNNNGIPFRRQELRKIVERVYDYHKLFAYDWLLCGKGLELQYKESQVTFKVIEKFLELNKVVITVHDSFITTVDDKELLVNLVNSSYKEVVGCLPKLSYK
jgi:hypothetical protein